MVYARIEKLAELLVGYSVGVKEGERVWIEAFTNTEPLYREVFKQVLMKGGHPSLHLDLEDLGYDFFKLASEKQLEHFPGYLLHELENTDAIIYIRGSKNPKMLGNIDPKKIALRKKTMQPIFEQETQKRWVVTHYPNDALAQNAGMSLQEFEEFVYSACLVDWKEESKNQDRIKEVFDKGKIVKIVGIDGEELTLSLEGRIGFKCDGHYNMPDGEVFYSPVENSANGRISYTYPALYGGKEVDGIVLEFEDGKVVGAYAKQNEEFLRKMIDTDEGSRLIGEFGIGTNPKIDRFIKNMLYDEKMVGTIHIALGKAWEMASGTIKSAIHWDMLKDMRKGGKIYLDDELVQENGVWKF